MKKYLLLTILINIQICMYAQTFEINIDQDKVSFSKQNGYDVVFIPESFYSQSIGEPKLPIQNKEIIIPSDKVVSKVEILEFQEKELNGEFNILPIQKDFIPSLMSNIPFTKPNKKIYNKNSFYPKNIIGEGRITYKFGSKIYNLNFNPIQYNPKTKKLKLITHIKFLVKYETDEQESMNCASKNLSKGSYDYLIKQLEKSVLNPNDVGNFTTLSIRLKNSDTLSSNIQKAKGGMQKAPPSTPKIQEVDYVIITNESLSTGFQEIADWKTKKGLPAKIVTTEWIYQNFEGSDNPEKIRNFIKYAYLEWGTLWFMIGGDTEIVPIRKAWISHFNNNELLTSRPYGEFIPTDAYYACLDGNWNADGDMTFGEADWDRNNSGAFSQVGMINGKYTDDVDMIHDVFVGRIPVENTTELNNFKTKYFSYIKTSTGNEKNALLFSSNSDGLFSSSMDDVSSCFKSSIQKDKLYECNIENTNNCGTKTDVLNCLNGLNNKNYHIICGNGHAGDKGFEACNENINLSEIDGLQNSSTGQILFNNHCSTLMFDKDCIGEHFLTANHGGVAYIGNTRYGWSNMTPYLNQLFILNIWDIEKIGSSFLNTENTQYYNNSVDGEYRWSLLSLNLAADPEMDIWSDVPKNLDVTVSPTAIVGENTISVTINNLDSIGINPLGYQQLARICLQKGDEVYEILDVTSNGTYQLNINPKTTGEITVTITVDHFNFIPFETIIPVNINQNVYTSNLTFDDDKLGNSNGNNDLQIDAGETIELSVELKNNAQTTYSNVSATLSCNSSLITISNNQSSFGDISSGSTSISLSKYVFTVDKDAVETLVNDENPITFSLVITDGANNTYTEKFNIDVFATKLVIADWEIITTGNGDKIIDPNETVTCNFKLLNKGKAEATGLTAILININFNMLNNSNYVTYPNIGKYETKENTSYFEITTKSDYSTGNPIRLLLYVKDEYDKYTTLPFYLTSNVQKIELSNIDFYSDETEIELFLKTPLPSSEVSGYNIYRCSIDENGNEIGDYVKLNTFPFPFPYYKDYNLERLTKYHYKISAITPDGNEGELSNPIETWTSCVTKEGFPIQMDKGRKMEGSVNVADINNDGFKEIFTTSYDSNTDGYIIGLNADGTDLYDIDNNTTTRSGFAQFTNLINATPAIADLKQNGNYSVISVTRNFPSGTGTNYISNHSSNDNNNDGKPDLLWKKTINFTSYRGAVISNMYGIDNNLEIVANNTELNSDGIQVFNADGDKKYSFSNGKSYSAIAVADLDNDGDKEIIAGYADGIYIWHHNGTPFSTNPIISASNGYEFHSSPVICDIDKDGNKEILIAAIRPDGGDSRVFAVNTDGSIVTGWNNNNNLQTIPYPESWHSQDISVGDLDNDGNLEVVAIGTNILKVWDKNGNVISSTTVNNLLPGKNVPILADVDGEPDAEIIFGSQIDDKIYAFKMNGDKAIGFPLRLNSPMLYGSPCVADVDNNGKNDLIVASDNIIYMWETNGNPNRIEWGSERHNCWNTGSYGDFTVLPTEPTITLKDETININGENANRYDIVFSHKISNNYVQYRTLNIGSNNSIQLDDLDIEKGIINKIEVKAYNNVGESTYSDAILIYYAACDEKSQFITNSDLNSEADIQKYETPNTITAGGNLVLPIEKTVIFSAANSILLSPGFHAPNGCIFKAYIEGCSQFSPAPQAVLNEELTNIVNINSTSDINIYPNPTNGHLVINTNLNGKDCNIKIINLQGNVILDQKINSNIYIIDISNYTNGVYILEINDEKYKVVKE